MSMFKIKIKSFRNIATAIIIILMLFIQSCTQKNEEPEEKILVKIGKETISVDEFIRRAEYTVRPPYCRGNQNLDKKVIINSLIAEKLMSIEATDTNSFITNERIQGYLRGRKEQAMRLWLYEKEAREKVQLDSAKIWNTVRVAGRRYKISYFSIPDSIFAREVNNEIRDKNQSFEEVFSDFIGSDSLPKREVEWSSQEEDKILDSLYSKPLLKNQVVGPVKISNDHYIMMKINGWIDRVALTENQVQERWRNVSDEFKQRKAVKLYDQLIFKVMKGKSIEFMPDVFYKIANLLGPIYIQTDSEKKKSLNNSFWNKDNDIEKYQDVQSQIETLYQEPFFKVNDQIWTVKDFVDELNAHPLVFRKDRMANKEFGQQLQFAIMDMIRDKYLAKLAYDRGYDKINVIQRNVNMWKDNVNYQYYKHNYLRGILPDTTKEMDYIPLIEDYLNPQVDSLQKKYSDQIEVDVQAFNDIELTRIDMSVTQSNVPFPKVVPSFPLVTTDNKLDYGRKMQKEEN
jgi:hypothetical protein